MTEPEDRVQRRAAAPLPEGSASALKEWAAIEQVLSAGAVSLLIRKGGLWERRDGFEMEHRQFWIFPTLYHQNPRELRPEFSWALERARAAHPDVNHVRLEHFAVVTDAFRIEQLDTVREISAGQALTEETIDTRFHYRNRPYIHALVLRVHRMPEPHLLPNTLGYEGCVSWVELDEQLSVSGARPVLEEDSFYAGRQELLNRLRGRPGVTRV